MDKEKKMEDKEVVVDAQYATLPTGKILTTSDKAVFSLRATANMDNGFVGSYHKDRLIVHLLSDG